MPKTLVNVNTQDAYTDTGGANINSVYQSRGGWVTLPASVYAQIQHSPLGAQQGQEQWSEEFVLPSGAHYLQPDLIGIRFRSFTPGSPVSVSAALFFKDEPAMQLGGSGISTPSTSVASLNFQHNDVAVATEPTADFEDQAAGSVNLTITWTVVDDPANTRVKITPLVAWANPTVFPHPISTGPSSNTFSGTQTTGVFIDQANGITAFDTVPFVLLNSGLTADTVNRFNINYAGQIQWGPGGAGAVDVTLARTSVGGISFTSATTNVFTTASFVAAMGGDGASPAFNAIGASTGAAINGGGVVQVSRASSVTNPVFTVTNPAATTDWRFAIESEGTIKWAAANTAFDIQLSRVVNAPTGTGSFLEILAGSGFGYGTGTGGTATITSGSSGTINKPTGKVTAAASVANTATGSYTVTNSVVGIDDTVIVNIVATGGNIQRVFVKVQAGSFIIDYENQSGVAQTPVFTFAVIKGAVA